MSNDLCAALLGLVCCLIVLAAVGHGLWLLGAAVLRLLTSADPEAQPPRKQAARGSRLESCVRCGKPYAVGQSRCPYCRLLFDSELAVELRELEAAARRVQAFHDSGRLDPAVCEQVYRCIEARQQALLQGAAGAAPPGTALPPAAAEADILTALPVEVPAEAPPAVAVPLAVAPAPQGAPPGPAPALAPEAGPAAPAAPPSPPAPRRSLTELLAAFTEQRNILWGELLGGLLIVGCSIALVISLWQALEQVPYFPFLILAAVTGVLFGAGWYTLRHWKLETTSRGLLVIGTLLVPLNFLVLARLAGTQGALLEALAGVAAGGGFALLTAVAAGALVAPELSPGRVPARWLTALAVVGASASQLLIPHLLADAASPGRVLLLGLLPAACDGLVLAAVLCGLTRRPRIDPGLAWSLFGLLGLTTFALAVTLGLLLQWNGDRPVALHALALAVAGAGVPLLAGGALVRRKLVVHQAMAGDDMGDAPSAASDLGPRTTTAVAATAITLAGAAVLLAALCLAWPAPWALILVGAFNAVALTAVALGYRLPAAHAPALLCLAISSVILFRLTGGGLEGAGDDGGVLLLRLAAPPSGVALAVLALVLAATAELLVRSGRRADSLFHAAAAGVGALLAVALVTPGGTANAGRAALVYGLCAAGTLATNARWRKASLSYAGALALLGSWVFALLWAVPGLAAPRLLLGALLAQATCALPAALLLAARGPGRSVAAAFIVPFRRTALAASLLAVPALFLAAGWGWLTPCGLAAAWLAAIWLVLAWWLRRAALFAAFQAALGVAVGFGVSSWLEGQGWVAARAEGLLDPRSLQAYGIGLAGLCLAWNVVRLGLRSAGRVRALLDPTGWPALDRVVAGTLVLVQLGLALWGVLPEVLGELTPAGVPVPAWPPGSSEALGPGAWGVLAVLGAGLLAGLWDRPSRDRVLGLALLALTVPVLAAGWFRAGLGSASALRWGFALCLLGASAPVWGRHPVARLAGRLGIPPDRGEDVVGPVRRLLVGGTVVPVLLLTAWVAVLGFSGQTPAGPAAGSFFARLGWLGSTVTPLLLVTIGLAGYGVREQSPGYAFAAGLVADVSLVAGYALGVARWTDAEVVRLWQLAALGAALWALGWLLVRPWVSAWREGPERPRGRALMRVQLGLAVAGSAVFLGLALWLLACTLPAGGGAPGAAEYPPAWGWTVEAGSALGWVALGLTVMAVAVRTQQQLQPRWAVLIGLTGLAAAGLLACSLERHLPGWGFRGLLVGWAVCLLAWAMALRRAAQVRPGPDEPASMAWDGADVGVCLLAALVLLLGLKAAIAHQDRLWAAGGLGLGGAACAVMAGARRREAWAFAAGLGANLAASLLVWHGHAGTPLTAWAVLLVQVNLAVAGAVALTWLALRKSLYEEGRFSPATGPLLLVQTTLGLAGNVALLAVPLVLLPADPAAPLAAAWLPAARLPGWLALLLAVLPALWYCRVALPSFAVHVTGAGGLLLGVVAACAVKPAGPPAGWDAWLPYHVLTLAWALLGLLILAAGWTGAARPRVGPTFWAPERRQRAAALLAALFPVGPARRWVEVLCALVVGLAFRGAWGDPAGPYLSSVATLAASVLLGALALWSRRPAYVYASGLLFCLVGFLVWQSWLTGGGTVLAWLDGGPGVVSTLLDDLVVCLAAASAFWTTADLALRRRTPPVDLRGRFLPFSHAAALLALHLLAVVVLGGLASDATGAGLRVGGGLAWVATAATAAALLLCLWDFEAAPWGVRGPPLYVAGLLAVGLALHAAALPVRWLVWQAALALAVYTLAATVMTWAFASAPRVWSLFRLPDRPESWPARWFLAAQALAAALVVGLSLGNSLAAGGGAERLARALSSLV